MHLLEPMAATGATDCSFFVGAEGALICSSCLSQIDACPCSGQTPPAAVALSDEVEVFKYETLVVVKCYTYAEYTRTDRGKFFYWSEPEYVGAFDRELSDGSYIFNNNGKQNTIVVTERTCFQEVEPASE